MLELILNQVEDVVARENFQRLQDLAKSDPLLGGVWVKRVLTFTAAVTNEKIAHGLTFVPSDVLVLSKTGAGDITLNYESFDATNLDITTTGACVVRLLVGKMGGN